MKILALISGGKDSIYNLCLCIDKGHEIVALGNLFNPSKIYLFQPRKAKAPNSIVICIRRWGQMSL